MSNNITFHLEGYFCIVFDLHLPQKEYLVSNYPYSIQI